MNMQQNFKLQIDVACFYRLSALCRLQYACMLVNLYHWYELLGWCWQRAIAWAPPLLSLSRKLCVGFCSCSLRLPGFSGCLSWYFGQSSITSKTSGLTPSPTHRACGPPYAAKRNSWKISRGCIIEHWSHLYFVIYKYVYLSLLLTIVWPLPNHCLVYSRF